MGSVQLLLWAALPLCSASLLCSWGSEGWVDVGCSKLEAKEAAKVPAKARRMGRGPFCGEKKQQKAIRNIQTFCELLEGLLSEPAKPIQFSTKIQ